jgi:hypothetical protein
VSGTAAVSESQLGDDFQFFPARAVERTSTSPLFICRNEAQSGAPHGEATRRLGGIA